MGKIKKQHYYDLTLIIIALAKEKQHYYAYELLYGRLSYYVKVLKKE